MPRGKTDLFTQVKRQAEKALAALLQEIREREAELESLIEQANAWRNAIGIGPRRRGPGRPPRSTTTAGARRSSGGGRVNWDEVLASVPEKFGVEDVMKHPGARAKGRAQVYPALSRWMQANKIKKIGKGRYQRL
ncbi:MAG TPA: hypothetical protein VIS07_07115 [Candidatus Binatia bacterium]